MEKFKIIIAEDEVNFLKFLKEKLEIQENFEIVAIAKNGIELLEILKNHEVDIVITDNGMPGMSGLDVIRNLKKENHILPNIIMISGDDIFKECRDEEIRLIRKPFNIEKLIKIINEEI